MLKPHFYIADVFAVKKYSGNQLAVFRNAVHLSSEEMQDIAREMHFSETTFILSEEPNKGGYDVRIFTPAEELPFAGHPTLGTAYIIRQEILQGKTEQVLLNLQAGQIPVSFDDAAGKGVGWMKQLEPEFGQQLDAGRLAAVLSLDSDDLDSRFPVQDVSTGLPHIIVPLKSLTALKRAKIAAAEYTDLTQENRAKAILAFSPEGYEECDLGVRMFADFYGVPEDPATGSGNGCLAAYLVKHRYFGSDRIDIKTGQGYEIQRPSHLLLQAEDRETHIDVRVGGKVIMIAEGDFV
ncbi:MAG: PhzF family phenazine biosynthesis protein [bacterium]|nr:PhzF family phenazine biosynthesis protein [bacterium]